MKKKIKLDAYERDIEKNFHKAPISKNQKKLKKEILEAAKNYNAERKSKSVTIRLQESDIAAMRHKAEKMGVPYQTYINIVIHRDAVAP